MVKSGKSGGSGSGGSRSLGGKITDAILGRANKGGKTQEVPRDHKPAAKHKVGDPGVSGKKLGRGEGRKKS